MISLGIILTFAIRVVLVLLFLPFSALDKLLNFKGAVAQAREVDLRFVGKMASATKVQARGVRTNPDLACCRDPRERRVEIPERVGVLRTVRTL